MVRILVADAHDLLRAGVRELLREGPDFQVCAEAASADDAVRLAAATAPDVVILGQLSWAEEPHQHLPAVAGAAPASEVLLLARELSPAAAHRAFLLGARGYLLVSDPREQLVAAVSAVAAHTRYLSPRLSRSARSPSLTARESEVLELVVAGKRTGEIAHILNIGKKTVETHRGAIMRKLQLHRLAEVVRYAVQNDLCTAGQLLHSHPPAIAMEKPAAPPQPQM